MFRQLALFVVVAPVLMLTPIGSPGCPLGAKDCRCPNTTPCTATLQLREISWLHRQPILFDKDCSQETDCASRCLCQYNNCTAGCDNIQDLQQKSDCLNKCTSNWNDCKQRGGC